MVIIMQKALSLKTPFLNNQNHFKEKYNAEHLWEN